jgi:hypothetical protein
VVGEVDPGRVVDRVHRDPAAAKREHDPRPLRQPEVSALADDSTAELLRVDPERV